MIIYAFYGLGKTTFSQNNILCVDMDAEYYYFENKTMDGYVDRLKQLSDSGKIVFTNIRREIMNDNLVDMSFIPETINVSLKRMISRGTDSSFILELEARQEEIMNDLKIRFEKAIVIKDDEYISNYKDIIMQKYNALSQKGD